MFIMTYRTSHLPDHKTNHKSKQKYNKINMYKNSNIKHDLETKLKNLLKSGQRGKKKERILLQAPAID